MDAEPLQIFDHRVDELGAAALGIEVFVAQHESSGVLGSTLRRDPESTSVAEVQKSGGRRSDTSAIWS